MKRIFFILFLAGVVSASILEGDLTAQRKKGSRVAVLDFSVSDVPRSLGVSAADIISSELTTSGGIVVVDRKRIASLLKEQELSATGLVDDDKKVEMGRLLAAQYIISGNLSESGRFYQITAYVIDVETSEVVYSYRQKYINDKFEVAAKNIAKKVLNDMAGKNYKLERIVEVEDTKNRCFIGISPFYGNISEITVPFVNPDMDADHYKSFSGKTAGVRFLFGYLFTDNFELGITGEYQKVLSPSSDYYSYTKYNYPNPGDYDFDVQSAAMYSSIDSFQAFLQVKWYFPLRVVSPYFLAGAGYATQSVSGDCQYYRYDNENGGFEHLRRVKYDISGSDNKILGRLGLGASYSVTENISLMAEISCDINIYEKVKSSLSIMDEYLTSSPTYPSHPDPAAANAFLTMDVPEGDYSYTRSVYFQSYCVTIGVQYSIF
ncbi:MAG TPA: CsgG/HfaB family protein [Spirochaetota bacterium]|nr:CsgG/HfaB family protein [Spirochaetota bacterium]